MDPGQAVGGLLVHGDQVLLKLEGGGRVRQQKRLPDWELEGPSMMPCDFLRWQKGLSMGGGGKEGWCKGWHVTESMCHEGLFLLSVTLPRFISHQGP